MHPLHQIPLTLLVIPLGLFLFIYSVVVVAIAHSVECIQGDLWRWQKIKRLLQAKQNWP